MKRTSCGYGAFQSPKFVKVKYHSRVASCVTNGYVRSAMGLADFVNLFISSIFLHLLCIKYIKYQTKFPVANQVREDTLTKEDTLPKLKLKPNK